jgi:hypothetical protein
MQHRNAPLHVLGRLERLEVDGPYPGDPLAAGGRGARLIASQTGISRDGLALPCAPRPPALSGRAEGGIPTSVARPSSGCPRGDRASHDPAPDAEPQRQGGALSAGPQTGVGTRAALPLIRPSGPGLATLARPLQPHPNATARSATGPRSSRSGHFETGQLASRRLAESGESRSRRAHRFAGAPVGSPFPPRRWPQAGASANERRRPSEP